MVITSRIFNTELNFKQQDYLRNNYANKYSHLSKELDRLVELTKLANIPTETRKQIIYWTQSTNIMYITLNQTTKVFSYLLDHISIEDYEQIKDMPIYELKDKQEIDMFNKLV